MTKFQLPTSSMLAGLCLYAGLGLCAWAYWPGLNGPFLFDDLVNLPPLGEFGKVDNLHNFLNYLDSGHAGPTGRPISMLSFLLNANTWPAPPWSFKYTNLMIHLLNGALLYWVLLKLLRCNALPSVPDRAEWLALAVTGLWLLHPMHVSTTLYVVQRMTMLSALFSLCGILAYLHGRQTLQTCPVAGYAWMAVAVGPFTLLALFSKENGALLPVLLGVLEFTALRQQSRLDKHPPKILPLLVFGLPALAFVIYLARFLTPDQAATFAHRDYSAFERGLTESRILLHYLYDLLVPKLYSGSLFNDDFPISTGLLSPQSTVLSLAGILALLAVAFKVRRSYPLLSLSILFFFAGHMLESTVAPLDLYYEHRNYLPSIFLFLPLVYVAESRPKPTVSLIIIALLIFTGFTAAKAKLWSSELELVLFWGEQHPNSPRAQSYAANVYFEHGLYGKALEILAVATQKHPKNFNLRLHRIVLNCPADQPDPAYLAETLRLMESSPVYYDSQIGDMLEQLANLIGAGQCISLTLQELNTMTDTILANPAVMNDTDNEFNLTHIKGLIALQMNDKVAAFNLFSHALKLSGDPKTGLLETSLLATHGYYPEALSHLAATEKLLDASGASRGGVLARHDYPMELEHLRQQIQQDMGHPPAPASPVNTRQSRP